MYNFLLNLKPNRTFLWGVKHGNALVLSADMGLYLKKKYLSDSTFFHSCRNLSVLWIIPFPPIHLKPMNISI